MSQKTLVMPAVCLFLGVVVLVAWLVFQSPERAPLPSPERKKLEATGSASSGPATGKSQAAAPFARAANSSSRPGEASVSGRSAASVQADGSSPAQASSPGAEGGVPTSGVRDSVAASAQGAGTIVPTKEPGGLVMKAQVVAGGRQYDFTPNSQGLFPRVGMGFNDTANVVVNYPGGAPGDLVVIQSEDGGTIAEGKTVMQVHLDDNLQLKFPFQSTQEGGIYRVTLRNGFDEKRLEFWGGPEPSVRNTNN